MLNQFASLIPATPPKGLTQNQYDWFLQDSQAKEMSLVEILISYDMIDQAQDSEPCQGHTLRQWIIQEFNRTASKPADGQEEASDANLKAQAQQRRRI